ncbi:MAG: hypothetical protein EU535_04065 [Promethearchaeota archaeon]|nr:MAG: hypothetical protein EU535_04065 [Candidatus Lokiarchaeota archaeon]
MHKKFIFIGHRGTRVYDENTVYAFNKATKYEADYIEFDVRKTKDNQLIIIHDATLDRTTTGTGSIKDMTYDEIIKYKTKINEEQVPLLEDVLEIFRNKIQFMIELKAENVQVPLMDLIYKNDLIKDCIFSSRNLDEILLIKKRFPDSKICYNITKGKKLTLTDFLKLKNQKNKTIHNINMISLRSSLMSSEFIEMCHKHNILAFSWDFIHYPNPLDVIKSLIRNGIDGILFDDYKNILIIKQWLKMS